MRPTTNYTARQRESEVATATQIAEGQDYQAGGVLSVSFAHATNDTYTSFLAPLLPALITKLAMSKTQAGLLAFLQSSPSLLQPVIGYLADRVSLRYFVILSPAVVATMMSLLGVAPRYAVVALLVILAGLSSASLHAVAPAIAGRLSGTRLGRGLGVWMVGGTLGYTLGPIIVVSAVNLLTLEGIPWLMVGGWIASAILFVRLRRVPAPPTTIGDRGLFRAGLGALRPLLVPLVGITVMRGLMVAALFIFLPTYLTERGASLWFAGLSVSIVAGPGMVGSLLGGSLSDRWGRRRVLFVFMLAPPLLLFVLLMVSGWAMVPVLVALGLTIVPTQVILMAVVQESCPDQRALANGLYLSLAFLTESGGAVILGALGDLFGLSLAFTTSAVVLLLSLPLVFLLPTGGSVLPNKAEPGESAEDEHPAEVMR
ncbi:MAG: MFS transporter [Chloroflexi bacterium B3_Chlor]|nr:MAG: MFS transporter [Chloroflexi bacterium B3_Chlor]